MSTHHSPAYLKWIGENFGTGETVIVEAESANGVRRYLSLGETIDNLASFDLNSRKRIKSGFVEAAR